jgi:alginate O-acetyltransferase complex protein AlgI
VIFTESRFLVFFLIVFALYWGLRTNGARKLFLLGASCVFYASWDWRFLWLLAFSTVVDFGAGLALAAARSPARRKLLVSASLLINLGFLWWFKYYNFFVDAGAGLFQLCGVPLEARELRLDIVLPVGISFYTFQTLSYTIDVYRGKLQAIRSFTDFALFVTFFPQLVAGPIVRASEFLPQLDEVKRFRDVDVRAALLVFLYGFLKKAVVADNLAPVTDQVFADPGAHDTLANWIAVLMWHIQEYSDFSGYSDMAIGTAALLGYRLPKNFDFPFFARNVSEFWRRWHITLSTWFRDYLYVSLGGGRGSTLRAITTGCLTMLLVGVWHGAGWQHAGFGVLMCSAIIVQRLWSDWVPEGTRLRRTVTLLGPLILNYFLFVNWIVFRAESWDKCMAQFGIFFFLEPGGARTVSAWWLLAFAAFVVIQVVLYHRLIPRFLPQRWLRPSLPVWAAGYGLACATALLFMASDYKPFVYFHF